MTPVKVECHGGSWMDEDLLKSTLEFLTRDALTYVVVDESQDFKSSAPTRDGFYTAPLAVVRVHVHNDATWEARSISLAERSKYLYREDDLKRWVEPIYELAWQADQVYARMNNCYSDYEAGTEHYIVY